MKYTLKTLPKNIQEQLMKSYYLSNTEEYFNQDNNDSFISSSNDLFSQMLGNIEEENSSDSFTPKIAEHKVMWETNNYEDKGDGYQQNDYVNDLSIIIPRVEKSQLEQKRRVKEKAEVFTPSWICNLQNNLVDDDLIGKNSFNVTTKDERNWTPNKDKVDFSNYNGDWLDYIQERRIEMTAGEGPYLMSPYDTTTGDEIPVRDNDGLFQRIGVLDRKMRVVTENASLEQWNDYALIALCNTFGYEWQGDNLLLARLNFLNTYIEYYMNVFNESPSDESIQMVAEIASWNLWQMDGLKMVQPDSCSAECHSCKKRIRTGHDGRLSLCRFATPEGFSIKIFNDFVQK